MKLIFIRRKLWVIWGSCVAAIVLIIFGLVRGFGPSASLKAREGRAAFEKLQKEINETDIVFIGGYARSGTTLIRSIIDVEDTIYCGPETKIVPWLLDLLSKYRIKNQTQKELVNALIDPQSLDMSTAAFIYSLLRKNNQVIGDLRGKKASNDESSIKIPPEYKKRHENIETLCAKDPNILYYMVQLNRLFPRAKFVYMVRDGRAVAYSMLKRQKQEPTFVKFRNELSPWSMFNYIVHRQCLMVGLEICHLIRYEDLVLDTEKTLRDLMKFLGIKWSNDFLRHEDFINLKILTSETEWSTGQVKRSMYNESLYEWVGKIKDYDAKMVSLLTSMLTVFHYEFDVPQRRMQK